MIGDALYEELSGLLQIHVSGAVIRIATIFINWPVASR